MGPATRSMIRRLQRVRGRLPWLLVGLIMSTAGTALMASFEATLKAHVSIAFFIPALVYLADAIGTQTEAIAVRGLSLESRPLWRVLAGEAMTGALIGLVLGALSFLGVLAVYGDARLASRCRHIAVHRRFTRKLTRPAAAVAVVTYGA